MTEAVRMDRFLSSNVTAIILNRPPVSQKMFSPTSANSGHLHRSSLLEIREAEKFFERSVVDLH